jgi:hypothetical protein
MTINRPSSTQQERSEAVREKRRERGRARNGPSLGGGKEGVPAIAKGPRIRFVADLLAMGWSAPKIFRKLEEEHERGSKVADIFTSPRGNLVSYPTILALYREVEAEFKVTFERDRDAWANQLKAMILDLYERAIADKQLAAAGQCLDRLAKLEGLYTERLELSGPGGGAIQIAASEADITVLSDDELAEYERLNAKIYAKSRERLAAQRLNVIGDTTARLASGSGANGGQDPGGESPP